MSETTLEQNPIPLENLNEQGQPPSSRVKDANRAREIATTVWKAGESRRLFNSKLAGMVGGNPPFDPVKLKSAGQTWQVNINSGEAKAILSSSLVPDYDLFSGARHYAQVHTAKGNVNEKEDWSGIITEEFDKMLKDWDGFDFNMHSILHDRKLYGKGFGIWRHKYDWQFRRIAQDRLCVPDGSEADVCYQDCVVVRESYRVHELWEQVKDGAQNGWNKEEVIAQIQLAQPDIDNEDPQEIQRQMRDHDLYWGLKLGTVKAWRIYVREFSGRVSLYIVSDIPSGKAERYLYRSDECFDDMAQAMWATFFETLDGSWNGASALGKDIFPHMQTGDRLLCSIYTNAFMQASIVVQPTTANDANKLQAIKVGAITVIPPGLTVQNSQIFANINGPTQVREYASHIVNTNTGIYRPRPERESGNPPSASEVILRRQDATTLTNSAVNRLYGDLDKLYAEVYRRAAASDLTSQTEGERMAKDFQKRCKDRGVPMDAVRNVEWVRSSRNIGNGSLLLRQQNLAGLMPFVPMLPEGGKVRFVEDVISVFTNQSMVQRYMPRAEIGGQASDQEAWALMENTSLESGNPVAITDSQNHLAHAKVPMAAAAQAISQAMQTGEVEPAIRTVEALMPHARQHIDILSKDPNRKREVSDLEQTFKEIASAQDEMVRTYQQQQQQMMEQQQMMMRAQALQQGTDPELQIKAAESQAKIGLSQAKTQQMMAQKQAKFEQSMVLDDAKTAAAIRRQQAQANAKAASKSE